MSLFAQLDDVLNNQLDPLVETLQSAEPAFYHAYQTARSIVDSAASHELKTTTLQQPADLPKAA